MRRGFMLASAMTLVLGASSLSAQAKDFSGKWTLVADTTQPGGGRGGLGMAVTIAQDAKTITITRTTQAGEVKSVYNLDGSDSKNTAMGRGGAATDVISHAKWDGPKLVISTTRQGPNGPTESTQTFSMDAGGDMWVEQPGRPAAGGAAPMMAKYHYKKG